MASDSGYDGPETTSTFTINGRSVRLVMPSDPDRLLEDPAVLAWNARDDYMPYWAYLWPGAFLLAEAVAAEPWGDGLDALELGCGLGLSGLFGLASGLSRVHFTDYDAAPLRFVSRSASENGYGPDRASTGLLDWRSPPAASYPVILGADVLYERRLIPMVVGVLRSMLSPEGFALISGPYRVATEDLEPSLSPAGLRFSSSPVTARDDHGRTVRGTLHRIWKSRVVRGSGRSRRTG